MREDRRRVRAEGHERSMPQGKLAAVADQDVEPQDRDGEDQRLRPFACEEARDHGGKAEQEHDHDDDQPVARRRAPKPVHQTRRIAARPNNPLGLRTRTAMMIASPTASWRSPPTPGRYA